MGSDRRARIRELFEVWLDETLSAEGPPEGIDGELLAELEGRPATGDDPRDLSTLWSATTALTQEVKLQGRAFSQLRDTLGDLAELPAAVERSVEAQAEAATAASRLTEQREREIRRAAERQAQAQFLDALIDLRDRMVRGLRTARDHVRSVRASLESSWILRLSGGAPRELLEAAQAHERGYLMSLERLDELLEAQGVREIPVRRGDPFDPRTMHVMGVTSARDLDEGKVAEVVRPGYRRDDGLLRYSEVMVTRAGSK